MLMINLATAPDGDTPKTDCSESCTATPAPGSSVGTSTDSSHTATPTPGLSAGMSADSSCTITPVPGAEHEHSGTVAPTPLADLEHSGTATVVSSTEPSRTGMPAVSESAAAVTLNPSACEPSHLLVSPSVQDTPDSDLSAPKEPAPLPSCGLTLSQPVSHEIQPSPWDLKLDMPFCFDELYAPLPGDTVSDPLTMSPFIWSHASATPFSNVPSDYSISFAPYIGHQVPVLPEFPNWNLDPGIIQVPNPQVNFALPTNE
ncbi:hypothetical protein JVT61DRAFT_1491 [Boletus reticuloceps]|uniref:Uncharacterized protein n=1 Tax=Boletus reticuloceps TaxID=495285 RepID=A0A8I2YC47_9AGAM|nr:hypothetical protein JVT61DRAFT_1491 [Boletus reticuloceps]